MNERINKDTIRQDEDALLIKEFLSGKRTEFAFEQLVIKYKER